MGECYFKAAATVVPGLFGDGSDGDLIVRNGETKTLEVPVPHQSVVEMNYNSILIEAGGTLTCAEPNAGLVLRCKGDCTIQGTIDQSGKAPKTNPDNNYDYPEELVCGDGGRGADTRNNNGGGAGMPARKYGGGYSGGGQGASNVTEGGHGGSAADITIATPDDQMFVGGVYTGPLAGGGKGADGANGGGGSGSRSNNMNGGNGGSGPGGAGASYNGSGGGGAGNIGGGVLMLYVGGVLSLEGTINCSGGNGGDGGPSNLEYYSPGGGGGGAGGGAIYIAHYAPTINNTAVLNVNGGSVGTGSSRIPPVAGGIGSVTIKQYEKGMTA